MKFSELSIQTQRAAPAEIRTEGLAFLYRAGFTSRAGEPLALAQIAIQKMRVQFEALESSCSFEQALPVFLASLGVQALKASETDEYFWVHQTGTEDILFCPACSYASRRDLARAKKQAFSSEDLLPVEKVSTPGCNSIAQLADFMQIPQQKTAKALMFTRPADGKLVFVVVRGDMQLSESKLKVLLGELRLANRDEIAACGAVAGYASPVGLETAFVLVDDLLVSSPNLVAGANEAGFHLKNTNYSRDYRADVVADLTLAGAGDLCITCGAALEKSCATCVAVQGQIQFEKLFFALAEIQHDEKGLSLVRAAAPFSVYLMNVPGKTLDTALAAQDIYARLCTAGLSVLFDERVERAGIKFNDADLIGCPVRLTVGERGLQTGMAELKLRTASESQLVNIAHIVEAIEAIL